MAWHFHSGRKGFEKAGKEASPFRKAIDLAVAVVEKLGKAV